MNNPYSKLQNERDHLFAAVKAACKGAPHNWSRIVCADATYAEVLRPVRIPKALRAKITAWRKRWDAVEAAQNTPEVKAKRLLDGVPQDVRDAVLHELVKDGCYHG